MENHETFENLKSPQEIYENHENHRIPLRIHKVMKIIEFHVRIMKINKIVKNLSEDNENHWKTIEFQQIIMKIIYKSYNYIGESQKS